MLRLENAQLKLQLQQGQDGNKKFDESLVYTIGIMPQEIDAIRQLDTFPSANQLVFLASAFLGRSTAESLSKKLKENMKQVIDLVQSSTNTLSRFKPTISAISTSSGFSSTALHNEWSTLNQIGCVLECVDACFQELLSPIALALIRFVLDEVFAKIGHLTNILKHGPSTAAMMKEFDVNSKDLQKLKTVQDVQRSLRPSGNVSAVRMVTNASGSFHKKYPNYNRQNASYGGNSASGYSNINNNFTNNRNDVRNEPSKYHSRHSTNATNLSKFWLITVSSWWPHTLPMEEHYEEHEGFKLNIAWSELAD